MIRDTASQVISCYTVGCQDCKADTARYTAAPGLQVPDPGGGVQPILKADIDLNMMWSSCRLQAQHSGTAAKSSHVVLLV